MKVIRTRDGVIVDFELDKVFKAAGITRKQWNRMGEFEQNKMLTKGFNKLETVQFVAWLKRIRMEAKARV